MLKVQKCWHHLLQAEVISLFVTRKCQKKKKSMKIDKYRQRNWQRNSLYLLNDLRNCNKIFRKDVTYDNAKSHKKPRFHPLFRRYTKNHRGGQIYPHSISTPTVLGLSDIKTAVMSLDDYSQWISVYWIFWYFDADTRIYFDSFGVEHLQE